jgi:hypothetical protein
MPAAPAVEPEPSDLLVSPGGAGLPEEGLAAKDRASN